MRQAVFFRLRLRLSLQHTAALPTLILSLNLVQGLAGSQRVCHGEVGIPKFFKTSVDSKLDPDKLPIPPRLFISARRPVFGATANFARFFFREKEEVQRSINLQLVGFGLCNDYTP